MITAAANNDSLQMPFDELIAYLDALVAAFDEHPDENTRQAVYALLQGIDAMHREAFQRLAAYLEDNNAGHLLPGAAQADRLLNMLFNLYDLVPETAKVSQVEAALMCVRPYIESHGGQLKVLGVEGGVVHLEMGGSCQGCAGSTVTLQRGVEQALRQGFPGYEEIKLHEPSLEVGRTNAQGLITFNQLQVTPAMIRAPLFKPVAALSDLPPGAMKQVTVEEMRLLLLNVAGEIYAVADRCPGSALPISLGTLDEATILCPWHGEQYDVRSGKCLERAGRNDSPRLQIYPVALTNGEIRLAVNVPARPIIMEASPEPA